MLPIVSTRQQIFTAIQSNTRHQYALEKYSQRLTVELQEIDKLLAAADVGNPNDGQPGDVEIQGASRAAGPIPEHEFLNPVSPFHSEAIKRARYCGFTVTHAMKPKELDTLTEAVIAEFRRLSVLEGRGRGSDVIDLTADVDKLNWKTIAEKVSDVSYFARSDRECKTRWLGYHRPGICHDDWTPDELKRLKEIVEEQEKDEEYELDWVEVAQALSTNRTPIDCMRQGIKKVKHTWTPEADRRLLEAVQAYGIENWALVALHVSPTVASFQCQMRYNRSLDPSLNKSPWTSAENERLKKITSVLGTSNWPEIARHMPGRTNEMCREKYIEGDKIKSKVRGKGKAKSKTDNNNNHENSEQETEGEETAGVITRSDWTQEEDDELVRMVGEMGNKWQKISTSMGGVHTNVQCRLRYNKLKNPNSTKSVASTANDSAPTSTTLITPALPPSSEPSSSRHTFDFITSDSHPPILQLMSTSIAQSYTSANSSTAGSVLTQPPVSTPAPAQARPRPKPKPKARRTGPHKLLNAETHAHDVRETEEHLFSSNSASHLSAVMPPSAATSSSRATQKRPSGHRAAALSAAVAEGLESIEPTRNATSVPTKTQDQTRGWEAEGQGDVNQAIGGISEGQLGGWKAGGQISGWEAEGQTRGREADVQIIGWDASGSSSGLTLAPQRVRKASDDLASLSSLNNIHNNGLSEPGKPTTSGHGPRKKGRSRKSVSAISLSPNSSGLVSTPESGSSTLRRSLRLSRKC